MPSRHPTLRFFAALTFVGGVFVLLFLIVATIAPSAQRVAGRIAVGTSVAVIGSGWLWVALRPKKNGMIGGVPQ
jgi:phage shock protein PspC (stress-responsive transcriptional regulator)